MGLKRFSLLMQDCQRAHRTVFKEAREALLEQRELFSTIVFWTVFVTLSPTTIETLTTPILVILMFYPFGDQSRSVIGRT